MENSTGLPCREKSDPSSTPLSWTELSFAATVCIVSASFYLYSTDHIWEDYFITFKHSENWAQGRGLTYHPEERVHGFTSPIGTLIPGLIHWLLGVSDFRPTLVLFWFVCVIVFAVASCHWVVFLTRSGIPKWSRYLFAILFATEPKIVMFSVNGMETAFLLLFLSMSAVGLQRGISKSWLYTGSSWAGLMYTRPDGCVLIFYTAVAGLIYFACNRRTYFRGVLFGGLICTIMYIPWVIWAWNYYGTPIPHTILAKRIGEGYILSQWPLNETNSIYRWLVNAVTNTGKVLGPTYGPTGWPTAAAWLQLAIATLASSLWLVASANRSARWASLTAILMIAGYFGLIPIVFPWYYPPATVLLIIGIVGWLTTLTDMLASQTKTNVVAKSYAVLTLLIVVFVHQAWLYGNSVRQMTVNQREIEWRTRFQIGKFLNENMRAGQTAYMECLGYIGYFSRHHVDDFPGLVSPRVVALRQNGFTSFSDVASKLNPDWIVCRKGELLDLARKENFLNSYAVALIVERTQHLLENYSGVYGVSFFDSHFIVLKQLTEEGRAALDQSSRRRRLTIETKGKVTKLRVLPECAFIN